MPPHIRMALKMLQFNSDSSPGTCHSRESFQSVNRSYSPAQISENPPSMRASIFFSFLFIHVLYGECWNKEIYGAKASVCLDCDRFAFEI